MLEDRALKALQRLTRLEAELLPELPPCVLVHAKRFRLPACPVQRQHQLPAKSLPQRMRHDARLEVGKKRGVAPERELGIEPLLPRAQQQLAEASYLRLGEIVIREIGERLSPPKAERVADRLGRSFRIATGQSASSLLEPTLEDVHVELAGVDEEDVAVPVRPKPLLVTSSLERASQTGDLNLDALDRADRRPVCPEHVDKPVYGDHLVRVQQKECDEEALLAAAEIDRGSVVVAHFQRTE